MVNITLQSLSREMNITIFELIKKFSNIGITKKKNDYVSLQEKKLLLHYLSSKNELSFHTTKKKKKSPNINILAAKKTSENNFKKKHNYKSNFGVVNNRSPLIKNNTPHIQTDIVAGNNHFKNKNIASNTSNKNITFNSKEVRVLKKNIYNKMNSSNRFIIQKVSSNRHFKKITNSNVLSTARHNTEYNNFHNKKYNTIINQNKNNLKNKRNEFLYQNFVKPKNIITKDIIINDAISVLELSNKMAVKSTKLIKKIAEMGYVVTLNQVLDKEIAQLIIEEMGHKVIFKNSNILEESILQEHKLINKNFSKKTRPPVVTIMGHVDHGKTSLLDYIRSTQIANNEFGGITQHIGAYCVTTKYGVITFLDTPGHAAFTAMRARGTQITDIVVLVVAGDDGVKPQTIEAIQHAKFAKVPILVAINKIDKIESNPEKIKKELANHDLLPEEWGGETIFVNISSTTGKGINDLLNSILLQAEILELSAISSGISHGVVIESRLDKHRGVIATILVQEGQLKKGDIILCGLHYGKVRTMKDSFGSDVIVAGPSIPVEISGLSGIPINGDMFYTVQNEKKAREVALYRKDKLRNDQSSHVQEVNIQNMFKELNKDDISLLNIILKTDVKGSLEAISSSILNLSNEKINIKIISAHVGDITETDVSLAVAAHAIIIGFNVHPNILAKRLLKIENVDVYYYSVIYHLIDAVKLIISNMITPKYKTLITGSAEIRDIFKPTKSIFIAGCMVTNGIIKRKYSVRILRNNKMIHQSELESLRRFKEDVKEVSVGKECGIGIKNYNGICIGDIIESFKVIEIKNVY